MSDAAANREEQSYEIEALESMYPDDFKLVCSVKTAAASGGAKLPSYKISLLPTEPADEEVNHVGCVLCVECPPTYPSSGPPTLSVQPMEKLTAAQCAVLNKLVADTAEDNVGAPAVFTVIEALREWLVANNEDPGDGSAFSEMMRRQREAERAADNAAAAAEVAAEEARADLTEEEVAAAKKKAEGTPVNDETFKAWNTAFMAEMLAASGKVSGRRSHATNNKAGGDDDPEAFMTGKQWFENKILQGSGMGLTLVMGDDDDDEEGEGMDDDRDIDDDDADGDDGEGGGGGGGKDAPGLPRAGVDVNAAVFLNAPDDDLDPNEFSDDD
jgi:hypothetical protein